MQSHDPQDDSRKTLGQKIRESRLRLGLTQSELAGGMVTTSMISQIEADKTKPSYDLLKAISQRLKMDVGFFMNDADETSQITMKLCIAEYQTLAKNGEKALEMLQEIDLNLLHPPDNDDYLLIMARAKRLSGEPQDALTHLERLREIAFRKDDSLLFLKLYKESGYIEYAMKNYDGAMMEWNNAVRRGETLLQDASVPHAEVSATLREIYIGLAMATQKMAVAESLCDDGTQSAAMGDEAHAQAARAPKPMSEMDLVDNAEARAYLDAARRLAPRKVRLRDIADSYIEDALRCLKGGDLRVISHLIASGTAILEAAAHVQEQILLEELVSGTAHVWDSAAASVAASQPSIYFEAELAHAHRLLKAEQHQAVEEHLSIVAERLLAWKEFGYLAADALASMLGRLKRLRADSFYEQGEITQAVDILEAFADSPYMSGTGKDAAKIFARLIEWNVELGRADKIAHWIERLEQALKHKDPASADGL